MRQLRHRCTRIATIVATMACALSGCDKLKQVLDEAATTSTDGWTTQTSQSPVHGTEYVAQFSKSLNVWHQISEEIDITCIEREKALSVKFSLYGDKEANPELRTNIFGAITGSALLAGASKPIKAMDIVSIGDFQNELVLDSNVVKTLPQKLPLALEITSNHGTITYQIPKSDAVMSVVSRCVADQAAPAAASSNDAASSAAQPSPTQDSTASPATPDSGEASAPTDTNTPATPGADASAMPTTAAPAGTQPAPTPPQGSVPADPLIASLQDQLLGALYSQARTALLRQDYIPGSQDDAAAYSDSVANDPAQCGNRGCSIPWSGNGESFCVHVSLDDNQFQPRWKIDAVAPCH